MNIIFFGSDDFAAAHLKSLCASDHAVLACVTQPDKPRDRGMKVKVPPVKECAEKNKVPIYQPTDLNDNDFQATLKDLNADIFVVIAYGRFLPDAVLKTPQHGAINVHASLLPKYRGAAPINWAIINGEKETGLSIIRLIKKMDAGDILAQQKIEIDENDTAETLRSKMIDCGPQFLLETLDDIAAQKISPQPQDDSKSSLAPKLTKETGSIRWDQDAHSIRNLVRGLAPKPGAYTRLNGKGIKIFDTDIISDSALNKPGEILKIEKKGFIVGTKQGGVLVKNVQMENAKRMDAGSFTRGQRIEIGQKFE